MLHQDLQVSGLLGARGKKKLKALIFFSNKNYFVLNSSFFV